MTNSILFIDSNVADYQTLVAGLASNTEFYILKAESNGILQIADILKNRSGLDSVQIFSHGSSGSLSLGSSVLSHENAADYADVLKNIGSSLSKDGDILLYGCNVAEGENGLAFINQLAALTGADVAASDDLTGNGGDWILEANTGAIEAAAFSAANYAHTLAILTVINNADSGAGSLRQAITDATAGDTITFASGLAGQTITLTTGELPINKDLTIDGDLDDNGTPDITISGNNASRVFISQAQQMLV